jgi:putative DNA primase/helicase
MGKEINMAQLLQQKSKLENSNAEKTSEPIVIAREIANSGKYITGVDQQLRYYDDDVHTWQLADDLKDLNTSILNSLGVKYSRSKFKDVKAALQILTTTGSLNIGASKQLLTVKNGTFDANNLQLYPHNKDLYNCYHLDVNYDKEAKCPNWIKFLESVFENDSDIKNKIDCLQEFTGLAITPDMSKQVALFLSGTGSNGKGVFLEVIRSILEPASVNLSLADLSDPNRAVRMIGKTLAFDGDIAKQAQFNDGVFKKAVVGEDINVKILFQNASTHRPTCKFILAGNSLPRTRDSSYGYFRRWIIIKFNENFEGRENLNLIDDLKKEKDGIFNWMVEGLKRIKGNVKITIPKSSTDTITEYTQVASSVHSFYIDCVDEDRGDPDRPEDGYGRIKGKDLYSKYKIYCAESGLKAISKNVFFVDFEEKIKVRIELDRNKCKVFIGIRFKKDDPDNLPF